MFLKRYFIVAAADMPKGGDAYGEYYYIDLGSLDASGAGYFVLALRDPHIESHPNWIAMPSLVNGREDMQTWSAACLARLSGAGVVGTDFMLDAAQKFGAIHSMLSP